MTRILAAAFVAALLGCGDDIGPTPDVAGAWSYDWQVREDGDPYPGWDGHFRGMLTLAQDGADVMGALGYPVEDPAVLFGDATLRDSWRWGVYGTFADDGLHLFAPAPGTAYDDGWKFHLTVSVREMHGPSWAGAALVEKWPFRATR